jgi:hypothetical protein
MIGSVYQLIKLEGRGNFGIVTVYVLQWDRCPLCNSQAQVVRLHKNGGLSDTLQKLWNNLKNVIVWTGASNSALSMSK